MKTFRFNWLRIILILLTVSVLFSIGLYRLEIEMDVVDSLPKNDSVITDAAYIFENHPIQGQLIIDIGHRRADPDLLVDYGVRVELMLKASGLFKNIGLKDVQSRIPDLVSLIVDNLPVMFTQKELNEIIEPTLKPDEIIRRLEEIHFKLLSLEGIGQALSLFKDPLGWKGIVLAKMASLAPSQNAHLYRGKLISSDDSHLLVIADPLFSATDTHYARKTVKLMKEIARELEQKAAGQGDLVSFIPLGAYRAALDNELIVRKDVKKAIVLATLGIALLLVFAFPRPYLGLLALLPAIAGTLSAFFLFSLLQRSISIIVLGFGGAIISITVDHGIAYLLFLDRPHTTYGKEASREVWSVGLLAALTTIGAFLALLFSGFPIFEQLGIFTALGISCSFLFVHLVFPMIFPEMPPAKPRQLPLQKMVNALARSGKKGAYTALAFALVMSIFARPKFNVSLSTMNTVSKETIAAEKQMANVWGYVFNKVYLMTEGDSVNALQEKGDRLLELIAKRLPAGWISSGFVPAMIFPGKERRRNNLEAWQKFWNSGRVSVLKDTMEKAAVELGFTPDAFNPFYNLLTAGDDQFKELEIPPEFFNLMGISKKPDRPGWIQVSAFITGQSYESEKFHQIFQSVGRIFDPAFFSERLGKLLFSTFLKLFFIIGISVALLLFIFFLDLRLTAVALLPVFFAFISTLGTLNLIGHPLDIPGLMLAIIVIGMGIDYSLFFVRSHQRYRDPLHPSFGLIRMAVFMASGSTLIGFGVLCSAEHAILKSAGLTSVFGIGYALIGAFVILPPLLNRRYQAQPSGIRTDRNLHDRLLWRYRDLDPYPRIFARFKTWLDPMFTELPAILKSRGEFHTIIDIGCGYGVPASWLLERFPECRLYGLDPNPERVRIASLAIGDRGAISLGHAPDIPSTPGPVDAAMMLDIIHYLKADELILTLTRLYENLGRGGFLVMRAAVPPNRKFPWVWWIENIKLKFSGIQSTYRSVDEIKAIIIQAGFEIEYSAPSGSNEDLFWFIGKKSS